MSVYRRGKIWYCDFTLQGKRLNKSTGQRDKRKALEVERNFRKEALRVLESSSETTFNLTLEEAIEKGYKTHWKHLKDGEQTVSKLKALLQFLPEGIHLKDIQGRQLSLLKEALQESGKAPATVNRHLAHLKTLLKMACTQWQAIPFVPDIKIDTRLEKKRLRFFSDRELELLLKYLRRPEKPLLWKGAADLYEVLAGTGMRLSEALGLTYDKNIDLERKTITLYPEDTKNSQPRTIPMAKRVEEILVKRSVGNTPFPYKKDTMSKLMAKARVVLNFHPELCVHSLRHTFASTLVLRGVDLYTVQKLLGHSSPLMTQRYAHLQTESLQRAIDLL